MWTGVPRRKHTHVTDPCGAFSLFHHKGSGMTIEGVTLIGDEESMQRGEVNQLGAVVSSAHPVELEGASQGKTVTQLVGLLRRWLEGSQLGVASDLHLSHAEVGIVSHVPLHPPWRCAGGLTGRTYIIPQEERRELPRNTIQYTPTAPYTLRMHSMGPFIKSCPQDGFLRGMFLSHIWWWYPSPKLHISPPCVT